MRRKALCRSRVPDKLPAMIGRAFLYVFPYSTASRVPSLALEDSMPDQALAVASCLRGGQVFTSIQRKTTHPIPTDTGGRFVPAPAMRDCGRRHQRDHPTSQPAAFDVMSR